MGREVCRLNPKTEDFSMKQILAAKPSITDLEIRYVNDAITNGWGENCYDYLSRFKETTKAYFDVPLAWPTSSCHGALHIALMSLGIGPGDEVIVPDATWTGSVFPVSWCGAKPVFVDVLRDTWCIDPKQVEAAISPQTKAIIVVHLYGNLCEMDELIGISRQHRIPLIEDAAEAIGSEYKGRKAGSFGDFGVFSFHGTKTVTTGEGGLLISNRSDLQTKVSTIESQGRRPDAPFYWVDELGLKYKMSNLQAALGLAQFERIDELVEKKREVFSWYKDALSSVPDITMNFEQSYAKNSYWMPTVIFWDPYNLPVQEIISRLNKTGIKVRPFFYPVSCLPMYSLEKTKEGKISKSLNLRGINLPNYFEMTQSDTIYITDTLLEQIKLN